MAHFRRHTVNEHYFDSIETEEQAYILGFLYADGSIDHRTIRINLQARDRQILDDMRLLIQSTKPLAWKNRNSQWLLQINSVRLAARLESLGCTARKTFTLQFPEWLTDATLRRHFIRGYSDGDGCLGVYPKMISGRYPNNESLWYIISTVGFCTAVATEIESALSITMTVRPTKKNPGIATVGAWGRKALAILNWLYTDSSIHLNRKFECYQNVIANEREKAAKSANRVRNRDTPCEVCSKPVLARGLCGRHYDMRRRKPEEFVKELTRQQRTDS